MKQSDKQNRSFGPSKDELMRLAEALYRLPARVRSELLKSVGKHLVAEGQGEQLELLFNVNDTQPPSRAKFQASDRQFRSNDYGRKQTVTTVKKRKIAFGWYGGKFSHLNWLLPLLPYTHHYCEPFGGSAAVLLNRAPSPVETYNDVDGEIVNFFRVLRNQTDELIKAIALTPFSREEFAIAISEPMEGLSDLERARRFFIRARQVRTGLAQTASVGRWANCKGTSRAGMAGAVSRWLGSTDGLSEISQRLLRVQIENRPAIEVIRLYDSEDTLFYCDPPYPHETRGDIKSYKYEMIEKDHIELARVLRSVKGKVAISSYRCDLMDELYQGWRSIEASEKNCHSIKKPRKEALWMNY